MNVEGEPAREIARGLVDALDRALEEPAPAEAVIAATEAAHVLGLDGLAKLLGELVTHAGSRWPSELTPALERLRRVRTAAAEEATLAPFQAVDASLDALAAEVAAIEWSRAEGAEQAAVATLRVDDVIDHPPLGGADTWDAARSARLATPVAAALRAALDWLGTDRGSLRPRRVSHADSTLELTFTAPDRDGLHAASEVIAAVEGNLGPSLDGREWSLRVPTWSGRDCHLMIVQRGVGLAVPWHAVLRLALSGEGTLAQRAAAFGARPVTPAPIGPLPDAGVPMLVVAHGRRRGALAVEQLVWRLSAEPVDTAAVPPLPGLSRQVRTDEGEHYWVAPPSWLLRDLPAGAPLVPEAEPAPRPAAPPATTRDDAREILETLTGADVERLELPEPPSAADDDFVRVPDPGFVAPSAPIAPVEGLIVQQPRAAEPRAVEPHATERPAEPPRASTPKTPVAPPEPPAAAPSVTGTRAPAAAPRRALVAEDSIMARVFLVRQLAQRGFEVEAVERASELWDALAAGSFDFVCVDTDLPDGRGEALLREAREAVARHAPRATLVALARDAEDAAEVRRAGIPALLFKPVDDGALDALLSAVEEPPK